jgi:hypothetical protein
VAASRMMHKISQSGKKALEKDSISVQGILKQVLARLVFADTLYNLNFFEAFLTC